jgi:hypothetical protein
MSSTGAVTKVVPPKTSKSPVAGGELPPVQFATPDQFAEEVLFHVSVAAPADMENSNAVAGATAIINTRDRFFIEILDMTSPFV